MNSVPSKVSIWLAIYLGIHRIDGIHVLLGPVLFSEWTEWNYIHFAPAPFSETTRRENLGTRLFLPLIAEWKEFSLLRIRGIRIITVIVVANNGI